MIPQTLGTYVYLATLNDIDPTFAKEAKAYSTFDINNSMKNTSGQSIQPLINAFTVLRNIAATQSQKEHQAVQGYLKRLDAHLANKEIPDKVKEGLMRQKELIKNLDFENYQSNQLDLIKAINVSIQNLDSYERRLQEILKPVKNPWEFKKRFEFDIQSRIERFFQNRGKKWARGDETKRDKALDAMMDKVLASFPPEIKNEVKALLFIDFNNWVENTSGQKTSYTELELKDLEPIFEEYLSQADDEFSETHLQRVMRTSQDDFLHLVEETGRLLHSDFISQNEYEYLKSQLSSKSSGKKISFRDGHLTYKQASDYIKTYNYNLGEPENRYVIGLHSRVSHGDFYEHIGTVLTSAINISANVGGDKIIPIATVTMTKKGQDEQKILMNLSQGLSDILSEDFQKKQQLAIEDFDKAVEAERALSDKMRQKIEEQRKIMNSINGLNEKFFIAHETTKLYRGAEQQDSLFEDFHGRKMAALSALTKMYASPELANNMIDPSLLILYLINISEATLAVNKKPLETYLSLFAGLLMFDDIKSLAETSIQQIEANIATESSIDCIHVYNIGGIYFPISVILNDMLSQMNDIMKTLDINNNKTATAEIIGPTPSISDNSSESDWSSLANTTIQGTSIQIHFLAGFMEYVSSLSKTF